MCHWIYWANAKPRPERKLEILCLKYSISIEFNIKRIKELKAFIDNPLAYSVHQLNQFIRGHNYLYIDFLMTVKYADLTSFNLVVEFFWLNIDFLVKYIDNISKNLNKVVVL